MNSWFADVSFQSGGPPRPELRVAPVLLLRGAGSQVGNFVERILADLKRGAAVPDFLRWLTGESLPPAHLDDEPAGVGQAHQADVDEDDLFFTKPANQEQRRILRLLNQQSAIVVQGPPGTGKTHTIGNLIGHFLSKGWRVLVTSETTKALGEVRNQVVPGLNSLCVPLLDSDRDGRDLLGRCLQEINNKAAERTKAQLQQDVIDYEAQRRGHLARRRELRRRLLDARSDEVVPIVVAGVEHRPVAAAKYVTESGSSAQWIPGPVSAGVGLPLSPGELIELYASNEGLSAADDKALALPLPNPESLPQPSTLGDLLKRRAFLTQDSAFDRPAQWSPLSTDAGELTAAAEATAAALQDLEGAEPWRLAALDAGLRGDTASLPWRRMIEAAREADRLHGEAQEAGFAHNITLGGADDATALATASAIHAHLDGGRRLHRWWGGLTDKTWKTYLDRWRLADRPPQSKQDFAIILKQLTWKNANRDFVQRFVALVTDHGGPDALRHGDDAAVVSRQHVELIARLLDWNTRAWKPLSDRLTRLGLRLNALQAAKGPLAGRFADAERLIALLRVDVTALLRGRLAAIAIDGNAKELADLGSSLASHHVLNPDSRPVAELVRCWDAGDVAGYEAALDALATQCVRVGPWRRRHELLKRVHSVAPAWGEAVRSRCGVHGAPQVPGDAAQAWLVRQLDQALTERQRVSIAQLSQELADVERKLPEVTAALVSAKAWHHQLDRLASEAGLGPTRLRARARRAPFPVRTRTALSVRRRVQRAHGSDVANARPLLPEPPPEQVSARHGPPQARRTRHGRPLPHGNAKRCAAVSAAVTESGHFRPSILALAGAS